MPPRALAPTLLLVTLVACTTPGPPAVETLPDGRGQGLRATVVEVIDGDTLDVTLPGSGRERIRLLGIDTPETRKPGAPIGCFGPEASSRTKALLPPGTVVLLQRDRQARDRYGRLLTYLWRQQDHLFVNASLLAEGYARVLSIEPNTAHRRELAGLERAAEDAGAGLWGSCPRA